MQRTASFGQTPQPSTPVAAVVSAFPTHHEGGADAQRSRHRPGDAGPAEALVLLGPLPAGPPGRRDHACRHADQARKCSTIPHLSHLLGTCSIALEHHANEDEVSAALLHDASEDVEPTEQARQTVSSFGPEVLRIVEGCTDADTHPKPDYRPRKQVYIDRLAREDRSVLLVSASDTLHNARAIVTDLYRVGLVVFDRFRPRGSWRWPTLRTGVARVSRSR